MSYQQLLAGGLTFQLYNKQTNTIIPSSISDGGGYLEIVEDADDSHDTIYKIDQFAGAKTEITLYTEGQSAATFALMAVSQNEGVHSVRTFCIAHEISGDTYKYVSVEIDGKMYLPGIRNGNDLIPINDNDGNFEEMPNANYIDGGSVFPLIEVTLEDDPNLGEGAIMKIPSVGNITTEARHCIEIFYKDAYSNDQPWRYGQDGFFYIDGGWCLRVNGIWHPIEFNGKAVNIDTAEAINILGDGTDIYRNPTDELVMDVTASTGIDQWIESVEAEYGINFGDSYIVSETRDGDNIQPFVIANPIP